MRISFILRILPAFLVLSAVVAQPVSDTGSDAATITGPVASGKTVQKPGNSGGSTSSSLSAGLSEWENMRNEAHDLSHVGHPSLGLKTGDHPQTVTGFSSGSSGSSSPVSPSDTAQISPGELRKKAAALHGKVEHYDQKAKDKMDKSLLHESTASRLRDDINPLLQKVGQEPIDPTPFTVKGKEHRAELVAANSKKDAYSKEATQVRGQVVATLQRSNSNPLPESRKSRKDKGRQK